MGALNDWTVIDANNNAAPPDGWPENTMQYSEVNNTGRAVQGTVRRFWGDVNGSLQAAGLVNAYTLTLNESAYVAYFQGMYFACEIPITNTGAVTLNVNGIGVQSVITQDGNALQGGELMAGGIYEFRYDGTDFQLLGSGASLGTGTFTNSNAPDLVDTDVALRVGAVDPDTAQHVEVGPQQVQSKSNSTTAADLTLNALGGIVRVGPQSGTGAVLQYDDGSIRTETGTNILSMRSNSNGDPTVPDNITAFYEVRSQDNNLYGRFGMDGEDLVMRALARGNGIQLQTELALGGSVTNLSATPDDTTLNDPVNDEARFGTVPSGGSPAVYVQGSTANNPATGGVQDQQIELRNSGIQQTAQIGFSSSTTCRIANRVHGGNVQLNGEDGSGNARVMVDANPDAGVTLRYPASNVARLTTVADGVDLLKDDNLDTGNLLYRGEHANGTTRFLLGLTGSAIDLRSTLHGAQIFVRGEDTGGTLRNGVTVNPDSNVQLHQVGVAVARTTTAAAGGFEANNTLTGAGFERVLTTSDLSGSFTVEHIEQTSDTTVNNSTTLVNSQLTLSNIPTGFYKIECMVLLRDVAVSGCGARLDFNASGIDPDSVLRVSNKNFSGAGAPSYDEQGLATDLFDGIGLVTGSGTSRFMLTGYVEMILGSNSITLQFAQNTAQVGDLDFEAGSFLSLIPIS